MVAGADGDAHLVEQGADVEVVGAVEVERERGGAVGRPVEAQAGDPCEGGGGGADEGLFVGLDGGQAECVDVVERGGQCDCPLDVGGAGLVLERGVLPGGAGEGDLADHLAAAAPRGQRVQQLAPAPEHADPGGGVDLVAGEGEEIGAERADVDRQVGDRLGGVDDHQRAGLAGGGGQLGDRVDGAEGVGDPADGEHRGAAGQEGVEGVEVKHAVVVAGDDAQGGAGALAEHLPRDDVGVVFEGGDEDLGARADAGGEEVGGEVDRVGAAGGEDDLGGVGRVEVAGDGPAGLLVALGGEAGEVVGAAVDVGVDRLVVVAGGVEHLAGFLGGGGVVEVDERAAVDLGGEEREVGADALEVDCHARAKEAVTAANARENLSRHGCGRCGRVRRPLTGPARRGRSGASGRRPGVAGGG